MGNKNDYLTLEESARMIGRPDSYLKALMSEGKLSAKLAGGRWWISVRDFEELRQNLPPEPEKVVHNLLADIPPKKPRRVQGSKSKDEAKGKSDPKRGTSNPSLSETDIRKQIKGLTKQIRQIRNEVTKKATEKHSRPAAKSEVRNLLLKQRQLEEKRDKAQSALNKAAQVRKKQPKKKVKKVRSTRVVRIGEVAKGQALYRQITAVDRKIKVETTNYERAKHENSFYDGTVLRKLISEREILVREYAKISDPLGLLPSLARTSRKKAGQRKSKVSSPKRGGQQKAKTLSPKKAGQRKGKTSSSKLTKANRNTLELLHAASTAYFDRMRREAGLGSQSRKRTEKRSWWNEED